MDVLKVPLSITWERVDEISVWKWSGSSLDEGSEAANWFSTCLGKPARLVRFNAGNQINFSYPIGYSMGHVYFFHLGLRSRT